MPGDPLGILKPKNNNNTTTTAAPVDSDPLGILKKKDGTTSAPAVEGGGNISSPTQSSGQPTPDFLDVSKYQKPVEPTQSDSLNIDNRNILDRDIDLTFNTSLRNPAINAPDKFSLSSVSNSPAQQRYQAEKDAVKNNSSALSDYRKKRLSQIDEEISNIEGQKQSVQQSIDPLNRSIVGTTVPDFNANEELNAKVKELTDYKKDLEKSILNTAAITVSREAISDADQGRPIDLSTVGHRLMEVIGDPSIYDDDKAISQYNQRELLDPQTGKPIKLPFDIKNPNYDPAAFDKAKQFIDYKRYQYGADAMASYFNDARNKVYEKSPEKIDQAVLLLDQMAKAKTLSEKQKINEEVTPLLQDEDVSSYLLAEQQLNGYVDKSKNAVDQFPQVKRRQMRQRLNDSYFSLQQAKDEAISAIPGAEGISLVKYLFGSKADDKDIDALSSSTGIEKNQIKSILDDEGFFKDVPYPVRVQGLLQGVARGAGDMFTKARMGLRRITDMPGAELSNRLDQEQLDEANLKATANKLRDDMGKYNFNPYSIFNTMGSGVGQTAALAVPTLLTGGLAAEGTLAAKLIDGATTLGSGYVSSYEDGYKEAAAQTNDENTRRAYATWYGLANAAPELIMSPADIVKKVGGGKIGSKALFDNFAKEAGEKGLQATLGQRLGAAAKNFANVLGSEQLEEQLTLAGETLGKKGLLGVETSFADYIDQAQETAITTAITTLPLAIGAGIGGSNDVSNIRKQALFEAGNESDLYKSRLSALLDAGTLTQDNYNKRVSVVNTMQSIVSALPETTPDGRKLSYDEKAILAAQEYRIKSNEQKLQQGALEAEKPMIEQDTQEAIKAQNEILNPSNINENERQENVTEGQQRSEGIPSDSNESSRNTTGNSAQSDQEGNVNSQEGGQLVTSDESVSPSLEDSVTVGEMLDKKGSYQGQRGTFIQDGQAIIFKVDGSNREYEIGNVDDISSAPISEFDIEQEQSVVTLGDDGSISVRGVSYVNPNSESPLNAIVRDDNGNVIAVNLQTAEGNRRTFRGQVAQDLAYEMTLQQITNNDESRRQFEDFINTEEVASEINAEQPNNAATQEANADTIQVPEGGQLPDGTVEIGAPQQEANTIPNNPNTEQNATTEIAGTQQESNEQSGKRQRERIVRRQREQAQEQAAEPGTNNSDSIRGSEEEAQIVPITEDGTVGLAQAKMSETRKRVGAEQYEKNTITDADLELQADEVIKKGYNTEELLQKLERGSAPNELETVILKKYLATLEMEMQKNPTPEKAAEVTRVARASDYIGSSQGRAFRLRQSLAIPDDSLSSFFIREADARGVDELTPEQIKAAKKQYDDIEAVKLAYEEKIKKLTEEQALKSQKSPNAKKKTKEEYKSERKAAIDSAREKLRKLRGGAQVTILPYANELVAIAPDVAVVVKSLIQEGFDNLQEIVKRVHSEFVDILPELTEKDVHDIIAGDYNQKRPTKSELSRKLKDLRDEARLTNELEALQRGEARTPREKVVRNEKIEALKRKIKFERSKNEIQAEIDKVQQDINDKNYSTTSPLPSVVEDKEALDLKDELIRLRREREAQYIRLEYEKKTKFEKAANAAANVLNVPRSIMSSLDFSAPLRQGAIATITNPDLAAKAGAEMFKQAFSQKRFDRWFYDLQNTPRYRLMQQSGLYVANPLDPRISVREEQYMSNLAEKIPFIGKLVKGSERAYTSYLNKMRVDMFNRMADGFENEGFNFQDNEDLYKAAASLINNTTGRGNLGAFETAAPILNSAFFSPRLIASRMNILGLGDIANPGNGYYAKMPPQVRKKALKDLAIFTGVGMSVLSLLYYAVNMGAGDDDEKATVEIDPRSSDFGKLKIGNTRWDIWGGFQQYIRVAAQVAMGEKKSAESGEIQDLSGEGQFGKTRGDVLSAFVRGKLAPVPSFVVDRLVGRTVTGEKVTLGESLKQRLLPLVASDLYNSVKEDGVKAIFTQGIPSTFGVGVQNYLPRGYDGLNMKDPTVQFMYKNNLNVTEPPQGKMSDEDYSSFLKERKAGIIEQWKEVQEFGAGINEKGNPTISESSAVQIKPVNEMTHSELTDLMKSISNKATRQAKKEEGEEEND
jgi:hypothetical protein